MNPTYAFVIRELLDKLAKQGFENADGQLVDAEEFITLVGMVAFEGVDIE